MLGKLWGMTLWAICCSKKGEEEVEVSDIRSEKDELGCGWLRLIVLVRRELA